MASLTRVQQEEKSLQALAVVLQHPAVAADQRNICTLLQVSNTWRAAVQQSAASMLDCSLRVQMSLEKLSQVISFAGWLAKHAGIVRTLKIHDPIGVRGPAGILQDMKQLVELGLQVAASASALGSAATLRLQSYFSFIPATAGYIAALPAATLTHLDLVADNSNWCSALSRLTNLQQLRLDMTQVHPSTVNSCLQDIGKLQQLTQLQLKDLATESDMRLLPRELQQLHLEYYGWAHPPFAKDVLVNLQHLTALKHLQLTAGSLSVNSTLPVNLQSLNMRAEWPAGGIAGFSSLHQVTAIELITSSINREHLEALQHLPQLQSLSLALGYHDQPSEVAAVWHRLPLRALSILCDMTTTTALQRLMQHVATATRLTQLDISIGIVDRDGDEDNKLAICEQLQTLKHLGSLSMNISEPGDFARHDTQHLSALVTLTSLELASHGYGPFVDATSLCCLAVSLTGLRSLFIDCDTECSTVEDSIISALPIVGKLTKLEHLLVRGLPCDEARRGLQFLTGLSRLNTLGGFEDAGAAVLQKFESNIKGLQRPRSAIFRL